MPQLGAKRSGRPLSKSRWDPLDPRIGTERAAYMAGIIDGEGAVGFKKRVKNSTESVYLAPRIDIGMTHKSTIDAVSEFFACGSRYMRERHSKNPNHKDLFVWGCSSTYAEVCARLVLPFSRTKPDVLIPLANAYGKFSYAANADHADAYFAGLFDGEGYASTFEQRRANGETYTVPRLSLEMTCERTVSAFHAHFEIGRIYYRHRMDRDGLLPLWIWQASHEGALEIVRRLYPFAITKKEAFDKILPHSSATRVHRGSQGKLPADAVRQIRARRAKGEICSSIAKDYDLHPAFIGQIAKGVWYKHVK